MRTMYDSVNPESLPSTTTIAAGYADGSYANLGRMAARFPHAILVEITVDPAHTDRGRVLDVETGDSSPHSAPGWVLARRRAGIDPTVYCNSSTWPLVRQAFHDAGVPEPHYWIAHYDGDPTIPPGAVAKQYASNDAYDTSSVADYWPGIDPEHDMPLTPADAKLVADTLLGTPIPDQFRKNPNGTELQPTVSEFLVYMDSHFDATMQGIGQLSHALAGLNNLLTQLSQAISQLTVAEKAPGA